MKKERIQKRKEYILSCLEDAEQKDDEVVLP